MNISNKNGEKIIIGISEVHLAELEHQDSENKKKILSEFGKVETICQSNNNYEFLITDGFSQNFNNTMKCMGICLEIAQGYPYVKKCITEDNKFHLILTKEKK